MKRLKRLFCRKVLKVNENIPGVWRKGKRLKRRKRLAKRHI